MITHLTQSTSIQIYSYLNMKTILMPIVTFIILTGLIAQALFFYFGNYIISIAFAIGIQYVVSAMIATSVRNKKIKDSLIKYDSLSYKKYPLKNVECASCKSPNNFLFDWEDMSFKCPVCKAENGLEIIVSPFVKADQTEKIVNPLDAITKLPI